MRYCIIADGDGDLDDTNPAGCTTLTTDPHELRAVETLVLENEDGITTVQTIVAWLPLSGKKTTFEHKGASFYRPNGGATGCYAVNSANERWYDSTNVLYSNIASGDERVPRPRSTLGKPTEPERIAPSGIKFDGDGDVSDGTVNLYWNVAESGPNKTPLTITAFQWSAQRPTLVRY